MTLLLKYLSIQCDKVVAMAKKNTNITCCCVEYDCYHICSVLIASALFICVCYKVIVLSSVCSHFVQYCERCWKRINTNDYNRARERLIFYNGSVK